MLLRLEKNKENKLIKIPMSENIPKYSIPFQHM